MSNPDFGNKVSGFFACLTLLFLCAVLYGVWQHNGGIILFSLWLTLIAFVVSVANAS
jgi:multisubunit Na+/H+ antiporter MnhF subunit